MIVVPTHTSPASRASAPSASTGGVVFAPKTASRTSSQVQGGSAIPVRRLVSPSSVSQQIAQARTFRPAATAPGAAATAASVATSQVRSPLSAGYKSANAPTGSLAAQGGYLAGGAALVAAPSAVNGKAEGKEGLLSRSEREKKNHWTWRTVGKFADYFVPGKPLEKKLESFGKAWQADPILKNMSLVQWNEREMLLPSIGLASVAGYTKLDAIGIKPMTAVTMTVKLPILAQVFNTQLQKISKQDPDAVNRVRAAAEQHLRSPHFDGGSGLSKAMPDLSGKPLASDYNKARAALAGFLATGTEAEKAAARAMMGKMAVIDLVDTGHQISGRANNALPSYSPFANPLSDKYKSALHVETRADVHAARAISGGGFRIGVEIPALGVGREVLELLTNGKALEKALSNDDRAESLLNYIIEKTQNMGLQLYSQGENYGNKTGYLRLRHDFFKPPSEAVSLLFSKVPDKGQMWTKTGSASKDVMDRRWNIHSLLVGMDVGKIVKTVVPETGKTIYYTLSSPSVGAAYAGQKMKALILPDEVANFVMEMGLGAQIEEGAYPANADIITPEEANKRIEEHTSKMEESRAFQIGMSSTKFAGSMFGLAASFMTSPSGIIDGALSSLSLKNPSKILSLPQKINVATLEPIGNQAFGAVTALKDFGKALAGDKVVTRDMSTGGLAGAAATPLLSTQAPGSSQTFNPNVGAVSQPQYQTGGSSRTVTQPLQNQLGTLNAGNRPVQQTYSTPLRSAPIGGARPQSTGLVPTNISPLVSH